MEIKRRKTRQLKIGGVLVGGDAPVTVQSMTNTSTGDVRSTLNQIRRLEEAGCEMVRVAVPDKEAVDAIAKIKKGISIPLIADIHFDWRLAVAALDKGADALRINPGNIGSASRIKEVAREAAGRRVPIRIGVNSGSLEKDILEKHGHPTAAAMVESALRHIRLLEDCGFHDIKVSVKATDVERTLAAYRMLAESVDYPFHAGITEAGTVLSGTVKSAIGIGMLLAEGMGDTIRVSLTADPAQEVRVGWEILKTLGLRKRGVTVVACPTCGRIRIDCEKLAAELEKRLSHIKEPLTVAVMGCVVNGPGEAVEADIGIAGAEGSAMLYVGGKKAGKVKEKDIVSAVAGEAERMAAVRRHNTIDI